MMHGVRTTRGTAWPVLATALVAGFLALQVLAVAGDEALPPAVTVNGVTISAAAVEAEFRWIENPKKMFHPGNPEREVASRREAVDRVIVWELVRQKLAAAGREVTDREIEAVVSEDRLRIGDGFAKYLATFGQDEASYFQRKRGILNFLKFIEVQLAPEQQVSEEEIKAGYEKVGTYRSPDRYRAEYLQVYLEDPKSQLMHKTMADVAAFARRMLIDGATLEETAAKVTGNKVATRLGGGFYEMGKGPIYEQEIVKLKPGEVGEIQKLTDNNYLVVRLTEWIPSKALSLDEARPEIRKILQQVKAEEQIMVAIEKLKAEGKIVPLDPKYGLPEK